MLEHDSDAESTRKTLITELRELIRALDQRVPRLERAGEGPIAREAASLRDEAVRRIAELERPTPETA